MKKIFIVSVVVLFTLGLVSCKSSKKCPAYGYKAKTEIQVKA